MNNKLKNVIREFKELTGYDLVEKDGRLYCDNSVNLNGRINS